MSLEKIQFCLNVIIWGLVLFLVAYVCIEKPTTYFRYGTGFLPNSSIVSDSKMTIQNTLENLVNQASNTFSFTGNSELNGHPEILRLNEVFESDNINSSTPILNSSY